MLRRSLPFLLVTLLAPITLLAQDTNYRVFLDLDNNPGIGCTVTTVDGAFDGVEEVLTTTVSMDNVTAVTRSTCDAGTGTFGVPTAVVDFPTPWPVGIGTGTDGTDVVETYFPLHTVPTPLAIRLGFDSNDGFGGEDALLTTDGSVAGPDVVVLLGTVLDIPTLSTLSLALLSLLIAAAAWRSLRRRPSSAAWTVLIVAGSLVAFSVLAVGVITLDGDPSDWAGVEDASAMDPFGDAPSSADLRAAFAALDPAATYLYLRLDAARGVLPTAEDDTATVTEDDPATTIDVLANETNPSMFPLTITSIPTPPTNGTVVITNAGADLTYEPDPDFCNDGAPTDDFVYELNSDTTATVSVTVDCVDDAPTITAIADQTIAEDGSTGALAFTIADVDTPIASLIVTAVSSDQTLIPDGNLTLAGAPGANRTIDAAPAADQNGGPATITVTVDDGTTAVPTTFDVTVSAVDDPPTITAIADQGILEDGSTGALAFTIGDPDTAIGTLVVTAVSSDQTILPDANLTLGGAGANRTLDAAPAADENGGPVTVTVTVDDGTTAVPETFDITVTPVNDEPSFTAGANESVNEDAGAQSVPGWATALDDGDPEVVQVLSFMVTNDNNALFSQQPSVNATNGNLTYTTAANANGMATVSVTLMDDGGTLNGGDDTSPTQMFTITVTAVNDRPTHTPGGGTAAFTEGGGAVVVDNGITVADSDDTNLVSATLTLGILDAGQEILAASTGGTSITAMYNGASGVLSLTGSDTLANYQTVLRSVTYDNSSVAPTETNRNISCVLNDGTDDSLTANMTVSVTGVNSPPMVTNSTISYNAIGHTLLRVDSADADNHDTALPGRVASSVDLMDAFQKSGATDPDGPTLGFTPKIAEATDQGGTITLDDDGDFFYLPPANFTGMDSETLNLTDGTSNVAVTLEITVSDVVWYVEDTIHAKNPAGGDGRSTDAFETLAAAEAASGPGHYILVFETDAPLDEGITLKSGQKLYGQRVEEEAVSLLPAGLLLEEIADTNARPQIHRTNGAAVTIDASAGTLANVEIRHLDLQSGDNDAIAVTTGGTTFVDTLLIDENVIGAAGIHGIDLDAAHTAGTGSVEIRDNQITSTLNAIDVAHTGTGSLDLAINGNTDLTSSGGNGINVNEFAGTLTVTSFDGNTVHGDTTGDGFFFNAVTFDSDSSTTAFEQVDANNSTIGSGANPITGSGFLIANAHGDLLFDDLNIDAGGSGLLIVGSGEVNIGAGTGFRITTTTGTINAAGGPGLSMDPLTADVTLASMTSSGSATNGIFLSDVAGTVNIQSGSITTSATQAVLVDQDTVTNALNFTYSGTITNTSNRLIHVDGYPAGTMTFNGASLSDSGAGGNTGIGIVLNNVGGTVNISATSTTITQSDSTGISITGDSGGTINIDNTTITDAAATAILLADGPDRLDGTYDFDNVDVNHATDGQLMLDIQGLNTGGSVDFDAASALSATDGTGISITSNAGSASINLNGPVDLGTAGSRISDGTAFNMFTNSAGTDVNVPDLDVFTSGQTAVVGTGMGTLDIDALSINTASNGRGLDLDGIISAVDVDSITCSHSSACVDLTSLAATSATTFTNMALTCSGGTCFNANAAQTVEATGTTSDIDATNAVGINLTNTTIGGNDFTLRSVDASGAISGIILSGTGITGGFNILGDGANTTQGGNTTGGLIQSTTGTAILINQAHELNLARIRVLTPGAHGILADQLSGESSIAHSTVEDVDAVNTSGLFIRNDNLNLNAGTGFLVTNSIFRNATSGQVMHLVEARGTSQMTLVVENSLYTDLVPDAFQHSAGLDPGDTSTINTTFRNNTIRDARAVTGSSVLNLGKSHGASSSFLIEGNIIQNVGIPGVNGGVVNISAVADNAGGTISGIIRGNRIENVQGRRRGINIVPEPATGSVTSVDVTIDDNDINDMTNGIGIFVDVRENTPLTHLRVTDNRVGTGNFGTTPGNVGGTRDGVFIQADDIQAKTLNVLFTGNIVHVTNTGAGTTGDQAVVIKADDNNCTVNATVHGNTILQGAGGTGDFVFESEQASTYCLDLNAANVGADANSALTGVPRSPQQQPRVESRGRRFYQQRRLGLPDTPLTDFSKT